MVVNIISNGVGKKTKQENPEDSRSVLSEARRFNVKTSESSNPRLIQSTIQRVVELKDKYTTLTSGSLDEIKKLFIKDSDGLYILSSNNEKYLHLNALIGIINYFSGNKKEANELIKNIHNSKDKSAHYPLSASSSGKSQVSDLFISLLEFFLENKDEAKRLLKLNGFNKDNTGLFTSVNNNIVVLTYPNAIKGIVEAIQGNPKNAQKILKTLEKSIPKNNFGIIYVSNESKKIYPEAVIAIATLKLVVEGIGKSEEYLEKSSITSFTTPEGILLECLYSSITLGKLSQQEFS